MLEKSKTPKVLANFSPGLALKPWVIKVSFYCRNPEGVCDGSSIGAPPGNPFRVASREIEIRDPGLPRRNPGLELANAFGVNANWPGATMRLQTAEQSNHL